MLKNYFKIAFRNLKKSISNTFINLFGLVLGISAAMLLATVIYFEWSYDRFQPAYESTYRIKTQDEYTDGLEFTPGIPAPFSLELMTHSELFDKVVPIVGDWEVQLTVERDGDSDKYLSDHIFFTTPDYLDLFSLEFISGNPSDLEKPDQAFLSEKMAETIFGSSQAALGETFQLLNGVELSIAGVYKDQPMNTNFGTDVFISFESLISHQEEFGYNFEEWGSTSSNFQVYVSPNQDMSLAQVEEGLLALSKKHFEGRGNSIRTHHLQALSDLHYNADLEPLSGPVARRATIKTLMLIGIFILIMASINYINLTTSRAIGKSREIGIHKVMGSSRSQLIKLSLTETFILVSSAAIISLAVVHFAIPFLSKVSNIPEEFNEIPGVVYGLLAVLVITVTVLSGMYPALVVSRFEPIRALKCKVQTAQLGNVSLRRALMLVQFAIAQVLMIATLVAIQQMNLIQNADLGFTKDEVYLVELESENPENPRNKSFKQELMRISGVKSVSLASDPPGSGNNSATNFSYDNSSEDVPYPVFLKLADHDYFENFDMNFLAGGGYAESDTARKAVINETLARDLTQGNPEDAVGKTIRMGRSDWLEITGVLKDFTPNSLREEVKPMMITTWKDRYYYATIKLEKGTTGATLAQIEDLYNNFYPTKIYSGRFYDEMIGEFYESEEKLAAVFKIFAGISLIVAGLGLYGLVSFLVSQRVKEIGIRKTLGASVSELTLMISKEFVVMVAISFLISIPIAYYMMQSWLETFAYKIPISIGLFLLVLIISVILTSLTVGSKAVQAALANPVKSIKSE
ncbi:ABC transporter permease [Algoriphagus zhangzhouensis]|uniref:MacB-like core domain-containing protein n=1 Tax=Algoriphagus zhangzhouensis TaxID=1073327 RepID=A0A1M7ZC90_9BACT|nr:ABC transporter permease [Algoriphagus zhangzhouensis]TDY45505.1 MacB-like protein [Algoriphagus zhangzhouensis]SHO62473.1 MacB-like core domain-containing protein [Algoriphagus zhangzhouensis]